MKKILLIDDEKDFTELTRTLLGFHDLEVDSFNESVNIETLAKNKAYDLVVTDLMMPDVDGFEVVKTLRSFKAYKKVPMIILSAKSLTDEERKFLLENKIHFIAKPFEPQGLVKKVIELLA